MDRVILINFVVIICTLAWFTSSLHISLHRSRPSKKSFLDGCFDEINRSGKKMEEFTRTEFELLSFVINKKIDELNSTWKDEYLTLNSTWKDKYLAWNSTWKDEYLTLNSTWKDKYLTWKRKYLEEREIRYRYQALFDFTEKIEEYFEKCWPSWAGHRPKDSHKQEEYATLFLNIENEEIFNIRTKVLKLGLTIKEFIKNILRLQVDRNTFAHQTLKDDQIIEAYHHFTQGASTQACQVVCVLLTQADQVPKCKNLETKTNIDAKTIKTSVDKEGENHVLLWFSELLTDHPTITETEFIQDLIGPIIKQHKLRYPMAYIIHRNKKNRKNDFGCVLFNRFDDAFKLHKATRSNSTLLKKSQIFDVNSAPYKWAVVQVQMTNKASVNDEDGLKKDVCQIFNDKKYSKWKPSNIYATKTENSIICKFESFRHAMVGYQLLKNNLESSNSKPFVTFHLSDLHDPGITLLQWFKNELEKDKIEQYFNFD